MKVLPDLYDIISGTVRITNVYAPVLISIHPELPPDWQKVCKRVLDVFVALVSLLLLSPLYILAAIKVRAVLFPGRYYINRNVLACLAVLFIFINSDRCWLMPKMAAPALSSDNDSRITKWGKIMRKWRIDELPQFVNILKGDMSLVGPRPERKYYIDKIMPSHPHYKYRTG